jgi:ATP-dependent RNA helicase DDX49/DBP8
MDMLTQSLALQKRPHIVIATPGRLADHLRGANPPNLTRTPYLVFDEADRLLTTTFMDDLQTIV